MTSILMAVMSVHPRVCGVEGPSSAQSSGRGGSPPRVRGREWLIENIGDGLRFTPACAG